MAYLEIQNTKNQIINLWKKSVIGSSPRYPTKVACLKFSELDGFQAGNWDIKGTHSTPFPQKK